MGCALGYPGHLINRKIFGDEGSPTVCSKLDLHVPKIKPIQASPSKRIFEVIKPFAVKTNPIEEDLLQLVTLRNRLAEMGYADPEYDDVEDELLDAEDAFNRDHGPYLENVLGRLHQLNFPGQEVLLPTAYMAAVYQDSVVEEGSYELPMDEGVLVDWEIAGQSPRKAKLVLVPSPVRWMLFDGEGLQCLWSMDEPDQYRTPQITNHEN